EAKPQHTYLEQSRKLDARQRRTIGHTHVREHLGIASHGGVVLEHLKTVAHHSSIAYRRGITSSQAQQSMHRRTLGEVTQPHRSFFDIPNIEKQGGYIRIFRPNLLDQRSNAC